MIYEVIRKMAWNKFRCWNGLLRPYVELARSSTVLKYSAIPLRLKNSLCHRLQPQLTNDDVPKVVLERWVRNVSIEKGQRDMFMCGYTEGFMLLALSEHQEQSSGPPCTLGWTTRTYSLATGPTCRSCRYWQRIF